jgi:hypothetical protein
VRASRKDSPVLMCVMAISEHTSQPHGVRCISHIAKPITTNRVACLLDFMRTSAVSITHVCRTEIGSEVLKYLQLLLKPFVMCSMLSMQNTKFWQVDV